jgi:tetratricopeptide (TPR) repeat protein
MLDLPMATNVLNLADIWVQQGRLDEAARYLEMIPERHGLLPDDEKSSPDWLERLSLAHDRIADLGQRQGDLRKAEEQHQAALRIRNEALARNPENSLRWKLLLAYSHQALCGLALERDNFDGARQRCGSALDDYAKLAVSEETRTDAVAGLIWSRMTLADVAEQQGKLPEMLEHLAAASLTIEVDQDKNDRRLESVALHERRGKALLAMNDAAGAIAEANRALRLGEELAKYADDADAQRNLAILRHDIASIYRDAGRPADAARQFSTACTTFERLQQKDATNVEWRRLLAGCLGDLGEARLLAGEPQPALNDLLRALAMQQELGSTGSDHPARQRELATCQRQLGDWYARRGANAIAFEKYRQAQQLLAALKAKADGSRKLDEELAQLHARIGSVQRAAHDTAAIDSYQQAVVSYRTLAAHDPSNARWQKDLAETTAALNGLSPAPASATNTGTTRTAVSSKGNGSN